MDIDHIEYYSAQPDPVAATGFSDQPTVPEVRARRFITTRTAALFHINACPDEGRNCWVGATELTGNSTPFKVWKLTPQGAVMHQATVWPTDGHKTDSATMRIVWDAPTAQWILLILFTTHQAISGERDNDYQIAELRGLGVAAPVRGEGVEFDSRAIGQEPTSGEPIDYAEVERRALAAATAQTNRLIALFGEGGLPEGQRIRQALENKAKDALRELLTEEPFRQALLTLLKDGLADFTRDRAFEGATEALKKAGLPPK